MGQYSGWADLKDTPDISDPGAIHGHLYDALMCTRKVAVVAILKLEALVTVPASIPLVTCLSFSVLNDIDRLLTMDTGNLNYSHKELKRTGIYQINSSDASPFIEGYLWFCLLVVLQT